MSQRDRPARSVERIVTAARRLFIERGLAGVNMDLIAAEAGVARQTLYNRFGSKEAIFRAAIEAHWSSLAAAAAQHLDSTRHPQDVLAAVAADVMAFVRDGEQVAMTRTVIAESRRMPELGTMFYQLGKAPLLTRFVRYLEESTAAGHLDCSDPDLAARQYLGMIQESLLWPRVMGAEETVVRDENAVIAGAIDVFMKAYGTAIETRAGSG